MAFSQESLAAGSRDNLWDSLSGGSATTPGIQGHNHFSLGDKRAVSQKGGFGERTLVPVFVPGEHPPKPPFWKPPFCQHQKAHWEIKGRFRKRVVFGERTLVPVFVPGEHPPKPPFWKTTLLRTPELSEANLLLARPHVTYVLPMILVYNSYYPAATKLASREMGWNTVPKRSWTHCLSVRDAIQFGRRAPLWKCVTSSEHQNA